MSLHIALVLLPVPQISSVSRRAESEVTVLHVSVCSPLPPLPPSSNQCHRRGGRRGEGGLTKHSTLLWSNTSHTDIIGVRSNCTPCLSLLTITAIDVITAPFSNQCSVIVGPTRAHKEGRKGRRRKDRGREEGMKVGGRTRKGGGDQWEGRSRKVGRREEVL